MKAVCERDSLVRALGIVGRVAPRNTSMPVLSNALIKARAGGLEISATDLDRGVAHRLDALVERDGAAVVPARGLGDWIKSLPRGGAVVMELDEEAPTLHLSCGDATASFRGVAADEFPAVVDAAGRDGGDEATGFSVSAGLLRDALKQVAFAASKDEYRTTLLGVFFEAIGDTLTFVATDGFRLAVRQIPISKTGDDFGVIVPSATVAEIMNIIGATDADAEVVARLEGEGYTKIMFYFPDTVLSSSLIYGNFPEYQRVIPQGHQTKVVVGRKLLLAACKRAAIVARRASNAVRLEMIRGRPIVAASSPDVGRVETPLDVEVEGEPLVIALDVRFLMDVLAALDAERVSLEFTSPTSPVVVRPVDGGNYTCVLMPMRLD